MWSSYFSQIQKKYDMRVRLKEPLVIRFDGKNVTKDKSIDLLHKLKGNFRDAIEKAAWYFSKKYKCYVIFGTDEISFIFPEPMLVIEDLDETKYSYSHEILALFSQYFFDYFNSLYSGSKIFFHGKCFSINNDKIVSYIKYRSKSIKNVLSVYFLKHNGIDFHGLKLNKILEICEKQNEYNLYKSIQNGTLYYCGDKINIEEFFNGNILKINEEDNKLDRKNDKIDYDSIDIEI